MSENPAVIVQDLGKMYLLYKRPVDRLKQSIYGRFGKNYARAFWALKDVNFSVERGQAIGIIGRNGSGKSTLLEILAGTLQPTTGRCQTNGRIAALLELGAGFNVEFTGRENIFLNGATMGIPEKEMRLRLDEIIDFAQIGDFIDQPVKIYSSGMFVRLAFAIATSINPDILLIDEALAVGDAGFVIKCMNRMKQMRENGATIVLVTHDVQTVRSFCDVALWLHEGAVQAFGTPVDITGRYLQFLFESQTGVEKPQDSTHLDYKNEASLTERKMINIGNQPDLVRWGTGEIQIEGFTLDSGSGLVQTVFEYGKPIHLEVTARVMKEISSLALGFGFAFRNSKGLDVITGTTIEQGLTLPPLTPGQTVTVTYELDNILAPGNYALVLNAEKRLHGQPQYLDFIENAVIFSVVSKQQIFSLVLPRLSTQAEINPLQE